MHNKFHHKEVESTLVLKKKKLIKVYLYMSIFRSGLSFTVSPHLRLNTQFINTHTHYLPVSVPLTGSGEVPPVQYE